ncbi:hypothetical protein [Klebsiella variicola]|uniref:hypothetical protein n=1 Tax=Klebsiella variicola TaxID=244366 RepID=UPI002B058CB6|nr:hypothetical protein [Klebsiella variicola]
MSSNSSNSSNSSENKKSTVQRVIVHDGLDTSTAKMMLNNIKKTQESQARSAISNKEGKK